MKRPIPAQPVPLAQGIGLYSHVAATADSSDRRASTNAIFLPLGGPRKLQKWQQAHDSLPNEIKQAWNQLQQALDNEEGASRNAAHRTTSLTVQYGGLSAPENVVSTSLARTANRESHNVSTDDTNTNYLKRKRSSASIQQPIGRTVGGPSTSVTKRRHFYEADRDPRRRG
jgi:hypothetical protein